MTRNAAAAAARVAGYVLVFAFFGLATSNNGLHVTFYGDLSTSSRGELNFWLGQVLLLCPGMLLIGYGSGPKLAPALISALDRIASRIKSKRRISLLALMIVAFMAVRVARFTFLLDMPITDDELAVEFGGRVLASGHVMARLPLPAETIPSLFLIFRDGAVGSFDWPGGQVIAAAATLTHLGALLWSALAVVPVVAVTMIVTRRLSATWGFVAALMFLCSPMAALMSMTTHAQLASRAFFSLALVAFSQAEESGDWRNWLFSGALIGATFLCRPLETVFLVAPIGVWIVFEAVRGTPGFRKAVLAVAAGFLPALVLLAAHSYAATGNPLLPARFAVQEHVDIVARSLWARFGDNFSYNLMMLALWFLGPVGIGLVAAGATTNRFTQLMAATVVSDLCLTMFHDNSGLHSVGPIHYSECVVPLIVVAIYGLKNVLAFFSGDGFARAVGALAVAIGIGLPIVTLMQGMALRQQAQVQRIVYAAIDRSVRTPGSPRAVVLSPWFYSIVNAYPSFAAVGTWVHDWRRPTPDLSDDVLYLRDVPAAEPELRRLFPDRRFYRLQPLDEPPFVLVVPLDGHAPHPLINPS
jgi:hypothetical protein